MGGKCVPQRFISIDAYGSMWQCQCFGGVAKPPPVPVGVGGWSTPNEEWAVGPG